MHEDDLSNACWRKSSYSNGEGGSCVEVADGVPGTVPVRDSKLADSPVVLVGAAAWVEFAHWRKSNYSNGEGGSCVEVADGVPGTVPVRDSKLADSPVVLVGAAAWGLFIRHHRRH
ncbi:DUF397 domain-containing protein [Streptomyces sp. NPDC056948]|uniref:DUF397 domain-containing protein n=1 Tax=Streptomyces sp. NPDC056948 TaxID=3345975 RepID=UPI00362BEBCA